MKFTDICLLTPDVNRLRAFYEAVFRVRSEGDDIHATLSAGGLTFTFDSALQLAATDAFSYAEDLHPGTAVVSFDVDDADAEYARLAAMGVATLNVPTTHPWGARSFQFADPDGNVLNFRSFPKESRA